MYIPYRYTSVCACVCIYRTVYINTYVKIYEYICIYTLEKSKSSIPTSAKTLGSNSPNMWKLLSRYLTSGGIQSLERLSSSSCTNSDSQSCDKVTNQPVGRRGRDKFRDSCTPVRYRKIGRSARQGQWRQLDRQEEQEWGQAPIQLW